MLSVWDWVGLVRLDGTYALNDLEEDDAEEGVDLGCLLVGSGHLGFHPTCEGTGCLESACDDEDACEEEPEVGVFGREGVGAVFAVVLGDDLDGCEDEGYEGVLEDLGPCSLDLELESEKVWTNTGSTLGCDWTYSKPSERTAFDYHAFLVFKRELVKEFLPIRAFGANPLED